MSKTMIMDHPLVQHKVSLLRNKNTGTKEFKELVCELATLLCYEATRDLPTEEVEIETPIAVAKTRMLSGRKLALVPILRAGLGMVDGMLALIPAAKVGHIGMYRNEETLEPVEYYCKLPDDIAEREVIVLDPMSPMAFSLPKNPFSSFTAEISGRATFLICFTFLPPLLSIVISSSLYSPPEAARSSAF